MATILKTKNSVTAASAPSSLAQGELAVNITDKKMWVGNAATTPVQILGAGVTNDAGGSTTQVQYNSSGVLAGSANMTFSGTALTLANDASISGLTVGKGGGAVGGNTALGLSALAATATGNFNTGVGRLALTALTGGANNTALGSAALYVHTTGSNNTALGSNALLSNTTADANTAVGFQSLYSNTTNSNNTAVGYQALYNVNGGNRTAVGYQAGLAGAATVAVGYQAGFSDANGASTCVGYQAGYNYNSTTEDVGSVFVGFFAGNAVTAAANNTMIGAYSGRLTTTGGSNSSLGGGTLFSNTTGGSNVAIGKDALRNNTTSGFNAALGFQAGFTQTTSVGYNTYLGYQAGYSNTSGNTNTYVGVQAGYNITTGSNNTILGGYNGNQNTVDIRTSSNNIVLSDGQGYPRAWWNTNGTANYKANGVGDQIAYFNNTASSTPYGIQITFNNAAPNNTSQSFIIGADSSSTRIVVWSNGNIVNQNGTYGTISDAKLKENIVDATPKLDKVNQLKVRNFNLIGSDLKQIGFVAQEFEQIFPSMIDVSPDKDNEGNDLGTSTKSIKTSVLIPILVKAIQELKAEFDAYKATHP